MNLKYLNPALKIRFVHDYPAVKTSGSQKRLIKDLRPVCRRKNDNAFLSVETIHLGKKLIECLLSLLISAAVLMILPERMTDIIGISVGAAVILLCILRRRKTLTEAKQ